jgi:hypothetical protein
MRRTYPDDSPTARASVLSGPAPLAMVLASVRGPRAEAAGLGCGVTRLLRLGRYLPSYPAQVAVRGSNLVVVTASRGCARS